MRSSRSVRSGFLLLCCSIVVTVGVLETLLRIAGISYPYFRQVDPDTGFSLRPYAEGWSHDEGNAYVRISSQGLRDREYAMEKPEGTLRIAVLGDSFTEALQVDEEENFTSVLEQHLGACITDQKVEVLNFGVSGFGTGQELLRYYSKVRWFQPDIVILAFFAGNDIRDNAQVLSKGTQEPYFNIKNGELILNDDFRQTEFFRLQHSMPMRIAHWIVNRSRVLQVLNRARLLVRTSLHPPASGGDGGRVLWKKPPFQNGIDVNMLAPPPSDEWKEGWTITEALLSRMNRDVRSKGDTFMVMTVTHEAQAYPDPAVRAALMRDLGVPSLSYADDRIAALGKKEGFPVITLAKRLEQRIDQDHLFLHGFAETTPGLGHWNAVGHRLAGEELTKELCPE